MDGCKNCSKRRDIEKECPWAGTYHHKGANGICSAYKKATNADHIRAMSDEELAVWLMREAEKIVSYPIWCNSDDCEGCPHEKDCALDWLRQPCKE